ncbi:hypothetical protein VitviT2T_024685 [Vitis vinifera]|uniref:Protein kinase domain-containing protein n=1 Tax=Vitis vinifera TaxID=29760 RepID=A0ABY9DIC8_VITVI|nr:hypothetical protein VitviT2T_024685 [Vitis vinifera]
MALSDQVVVVEVVVNHEALVMSYKLSTLLTTHFISETSQGLLNGSHGDYELLPTKAQELLDSIVVLEITVLKLEQKLVALNYQLTQERNERRLSEYHLRHFPHSISSGLHCCPTHSTKTIIEPHGEDEEDGEMDDLPLWLDVNEDPSNDYFVENLWHHPNQLSEEMVHMRDIFLFLTDSSKLFSSEGVASPREHSWKGRLDKKYRNLKTGTSVAIKIIDKEKNLKVGMVDQIKREISVMRLVRHPNVVKLYEVMASKMKIYFVMEYAKGRELFNKVAKGKLKEDVPENLLLDENGNLKVSDLGLNVLVEFKHQDRLLHTTCGTPAYVAPEVINREGYDGAKADI